MRSLRLPFRASALLALAAMTLAGCGRTVAPVTSATDRAPASALRAGMVGMDGPAPGGTPANLFYPLDLGNHWGYEFVFDLAVIPDTGPRGPTFGLRERRDRDLLCIEQLAGRSYVVERRSYPGGVFDWVRYRQDGGGLYEADVLVEDPPVCAGLSGHKIFDADVLPASTGEEAWPALAAKLADPAQQAAYRAAWDRIQARAAAVRRALEPGPTEAARGGVEPDELTRLEYPLHPGAHWVIRAHPRFESFVERAEALDLAVGHVLAWRIRVESEFLGQNDSVRFWYGQDGFLKLAAHFEGIATDPSGNLIGIVVADESELLDELALRGGRFAAP